MLFYILGIFFQSHKKRNQVPMQSPHSDSVIPVSACQLKICASVCVGYLPLTL